MPWQRSGVLILSLKLKTSEVLNESQDNPLICHFKKRRSEKEVLKKIMKESIRETRAIVLT
jgi:hypothetical protein